MMDSRKIQKCFIISSLIFISLFSSIAAFAEEKICVVDFLGKPFSNTETSFLSYPLKRMAAFRPGVSVKITKSQAKPMDLKECLQGDYDEVIILSHGYNKGEKYKMQYTSGNGRLTALSSVALKKIFAGIAADSPLKNIKILSCGHSEFFDSYPELKKYQDKINFEFSPSLEIVEWFSGIELTDVNMLWLMESVQDLSSDKVFFYIPTRGAILESGSKRAIRGKYQVDYSGLFLGFNRAWSVFQVDSKDLRNLKPGESVNVHPFPIDFSLPMVSSFFGKMQLNPCVRDLLEWPGLNTLNDLFALGVRGPGKVKITLLDQSKGSYAAQDFAKLSSNTKNENIAEEDPWLHR